MTVSHGNWLRARVGFCSVPLARSSSICISPSLADMDMYSADMEYRFDWRAERVPS